MKLFAAALGALLLLCTSVRADPIVLADGTYASAEEYLIGTWTSGPRRIAFARDGGVTYENTAQGRVSYGRYEIRGTRFHLIINRSCDKSGACQTTDDPAVADAPFKPLSAKAFLSNAERWERQ